MVQRRVGQHDAQVRIAGGDAVDEGRGERGEAADRGRMRRDLVRRNSTIGDLMRSKHSASSSETWQYCRTSSNDGSITANGRSGRRFRWRSRATASALVASTSS